MNYNSGGGFYYETEPRKRSSLKYIALALVFFLLGSIVAGGILTYKNNQEVERIQAQAQQVIDDAQAKIGEMSQLIESITASAEAQGGLSLVEAAAPANVSNEPVVAIADAASPSVVGVTVYQRQSTSSDGSYFGFPFGSFNIPGFTVPESDDDSEPVFQISGYGSGVIISEDGYVLTNHHVVEGAAMVQVTLSDGQELDATVIGSDEYTDVALLKIDGQVSGLHPAVIGNSDEIKVGEMSVAIGNPLGTELFGTVTMGVISANNREVSLSDGRKVNFIQTDAAINSGNSGGGLFNSRGELIGITSMKISSSYYGSANIEGLSFAIPINTVMSIAGELMESGSISYPTLGISASNFTAADSQEYGTDAGVLIAQVSDGSPAKKAGIQAGDIITHYDGQRIETFADLRNALYQSRVGDTIKLTVVRNKEPVELEVVFSYEPEL
ncbi:MAG: S1C family serine protease [Christensenellales bacterium]